MQKTNQQKPTFSAFSSPKYWLTWFAIGLLKLSTYLPQYIINFLGKILGMLIYRLVASRRRVARINLKFAFPNASENEITQLNKNSFIHLGISILEVGKAWFVSNKKLKKQCIIEGKHYLDDALKQDKGIILLTGHFTYLEMGGRLIPFYLKKYSAVYKKAHNLLVNAFIVYYRSKRMDQLIDAKKPKGIIRSLNNKQALWFAPDQDFSSVEIVFTPFLGCLASTITATAKMAKISGALVVPFYPVRLENNKGYKLVVLPALENFPTGDTLADSTTINQAIEHMVYQQPDQYLWSHKRYKTQPKPNKHIY